VNPVRINARPLRSARLAASAAAACDVAARVSGLPIGSDVREQALSTGETVHILADPVMGQLYAAAVAAAGAEPVMLVGQAAFLTGITAIWDAINER
jgi:2-dehydro-3-deoxygalactonokinase